MGLTVDGEEDEEDEERIPLDGGEAVLLRTASGGVSAFMQQVASG